MKVLLIISVVLATALCAPTQRQTQQQQQQVMQILSSLLQSSSAANAQNLHADMQGILSTLLRHVRGGGGEEEMPAAEMEMEAETARQQQDFGDYEALLQQFGDNYAQEQVLAALQQWEGLSEEAKAQFDFGRLVGGIGSMLTSLGSHGQGANAQFNLGGLVSGLTSLLG